MDFRAIIVCALFLFSLGCQAEERTAGSVVRIDYRGAKIEGGEWVQLDSFRFEHIGRRNDARGINYPLPSNEVAVDSMLLGKRTRDYNPKAFPLYLAKNLSRINKEIPESKKYIVTDRFSMSYKGVLKIVKKDSSNIKVKSSKEYDAKIEYLK